MNIYSSQTQFGKNEDFNLEIARGLIQGHSTVNIYGYQPTVAQTFIPLWENATVYTYPIAATKMHLAGTAGDTASIQINGLDTNYKVISEVLVLNGATAVTTVFAYLRINGMQVTVGSATNPSGIVTLKDLTDTTIYAQINTGVGRTQAAIYTVPAGYTFYLSRVDGNTSLNGNNYCTYRNRTSTPAGVVTLTQQSPFAISYNTQRVMPRPFIEKTDIQLQAKVNNTTGEVSFSAEGYLIKNYQD